MLLQILKKLGVNYDELKPWEKETFESYEKAFNTKEIKLENIKDFIQFQIESLQAEILNYDNSEKKDLYLKACLRNMKMIHTFIFSEEAQKQQALNEIRQRFNLE